MQKKCSMIYWILLPKVKDSCIKPYQCQVNSTCLELTYRIETLCKTMNYWNSNILWENIHAYLLQGLHFHLSGFHHGFLGTLHCWEEFLRDLKILRKSSLKFCCHMDTKFRNRQLKLLSEPLHTGFFEPRFISLH